MNRDAGGIVAEGGGDGFAGGPRGEIDLPGLSFQVFELGHFHETHPGGRERRVFQAKREQVRVVPHEAVFVERACQPDEVETALLGPEGGVDRSVR